MVRVRKKGDDCGMQFAPSRDKNLLKVQSRETQLLAFGATERGREESGGVAEYS